MASVGPSLAGSGINGSEAGSIDWTNPNNAASDTNYADINLGQGPQYSHYLKAQTPAGMSVIPDSATINGIEFSYYRYQASIPGIQEIEVYLCYNGGGIQGSNKSTGSTGWPAAAPVQSAVFGGPTDVWGTTGMTGATVKQAGFGVAIRVSSYPGFGGTGHANKFYITVYYTASTPAGVKYSAVAYSPLNIY